MKYIRTKDGHIVDTSIYKKVVERTFNGKVVAIDLNHWGQDNDKCPTWIEAEDIVEQADTIDELCDRFVIEFKHGEKQPSVYRDDFHTLEEAYDFVNEYSERCIIVSIKGAIWTDKGLIYVAKTNDKGELELL